MKLAFSNLIYTFSSAGHGALLLIYFFWLYPGIKSIVKLITIDWVQILLYVFVHYKYRCLSLLGSYESAILFQIENPHVSAAIYRRLIDIE